MSLKWTRPQAAIFDLDGTLFQSETVLIPAYHQTFDQLRKEGLYEGETPPEERIFSSLGMLLDDIWRKVAPNGSEEMRQRANVLLLQFQVQQLEQGVGELYPGVKSTLEKLHRNGIRLFVASNGLERYVKEVTKHQQIAPYFEAQYSAGEFETASKVDLVRLLLETHQIESAWMVGDRSSDVEAGRANGLDVIGCNYADFGKEEELAGADVIIHSFSELGDLLESS